MPKTGLHRLLWRRPRRHLEQQRRAVKTADINTAILHPPNIPCAEPEANNEPFIIDSMPKRPKITK